MDKVGSLGDLSSFPQTSHTELSSVDLASRLPKPSVEFRAVEVEGREEDEEKVSQNTIQEMSVEASSQGSKFEAGSQSEESSHLQFSSTDVRERQTGDMEEQMSLSTLVGYLTRHCIQNANLGLDPLQCHVCLKKYAHERTRKKHEQSHRLFEI